MLRIAWVGIYLEAAVDDCGRSVDFDFSASPARRQERFAGLCRNVSDRSIERGMHEFGVVFVQHFLAQDFLIMGFALKRGLEEEKLDGHESRQKQGFEDCDTGPRVVEWSGQKHPVYQDMSRREESEERQVNGLGVPYGEFPDVIL